MTTLPEINAAVYAVLKQIFPGLPDNASKVSLHLEFGEPPRVEIEKWQTKVENGVEVPEELTSQEFWLVPVGVDDSVVEITGLEDEHRRFAPKPKGYEEENSVLVKELRQLREELVEGLHRFHRDTLASKGFIPLSPKDREFLPRDDVSEAQF